MELITMRFRNLLALATTCLASYAHADLTIDVIGDHEVIFEGLIQADANWFSNDFSLNNQGVISPTQRISQTLLDDSGLRRAELIVRGKTATDDWSVGFEGRANRWLDVFYRSRFGTFATWRLGQYKQPNSLEELVSTRHNDFVAKSVTTSAFAIARRLGAELATGADHWSVQGSIFNREITNNGQKADGYGLRYTYAPIYNVNELFEAEQALHLGVSVIDFDPSKNTVRLNVRPEADLANVRLIDSANLTNATGARQYGLEAAYLQGPLKVMAEYVDADYERSSGPEYSPESYYVSAMYNLTGENYGYRTGMYTVPLPKDPAGMWQIGARYSNINANSGGVLGGKQEIATLGVNWYWRNNFKFMANYSFVESERGLFENEPTVLELRAQIIL
jgi:phosphate-selective porin OprO and OprP